MPMLAWLDNKNPAYVTKICSSIHRKRYYGAQRAVDDFAPSVSVARILILELGATLRTGTRATDTTRF